jgi:hypothetical protein
LATDLSIIQNLSIDAKHLLDPSTPKPASTLTALSLLDTYSPATAAPDSTQALVRAYISDMRGEVLKGDRSGEEALGRRIDSVREEGGEIQSALGQVKV